MDNLVHQSKDKQDYILKQYETNVEYMRSESHNELQAVKNKMEASVNDVNNNYNSLTVKQSKLEQKNKDLNQKIEEVKAKKEIDIIESQRAKENEIKSLNAELDKEKMRVNNMQNEKLQIKNELIEKTSEIDGFKRRIESQNLSSEQIISSLESKLMEYQRIADEASNKLRSEE